MNTDLPALPEPSLLPCPFCGHTTPYFERMGTPRQSCIVACGDCGARHESSDEGTRSGSSWNTRAALAAQQPNAPSDAVPAPLTRTDIARVYREVYGSPRMGSTEEEFARRIERATAEALAAQQPAAVPAGWKPVPLEPTQEMEDAAMRETTACDEDFRDEDARIDFRVGYRAALAAAPAVQPTEAKEQPAEAVAPSTWSNYVADMIGAYLKWPVGDARIVAVAGIIERRRKFDPERAAPTAAPSAQPVAHVAEVHMSRYTLEWTNGPMPEGSPLYGAAPPAEQAQPASVGERIERAIEKHIGGNELSDEDHASMVAFARLVLAEQAQPVATELRVEVRECPECGHIGINDWHPTDSACTHCEWTGPSPLEDRCPGCGAAGSMTSACPECGHRDTLIAETRLSVPLAAPPAAPQPTEMSPEFTDTARAALLWVLWHHQGGSSPVGQPIRFALGMGAHERLNERQVAEAKRWAAMTKSTTADFHAAPQPTREFNNEGDQIGGDDPSYRGRTAHELEHFSHWIATAMPFDKRAGMAEHKAKTDAALQGWMARAASQDFAECLAASEKAAAPQPLAPLTEEEIAAIPCADGDGSDWDALVRFARAIERAHGIKDPAAKGGE